MIKKSKNRNDELQFIIFGSLSFTAGTLHFWGLWHLGLCLRLNLWHGLAGSSLVGFSGLSLFLGSLDGVITLLLTDLNSLFFSKIVYEDK